MSKVLHKENFPAQYSAMQKRLETHERSDMQSQYLLNVNTSGLTNENIDKIVVGGGAGKPEDGKQIMDSKNKLLLTRMEGVWRKVKLE